MMKIEKKKRGYQKKKRKKVEEGIEEEEEEEEVENGPCPTYPSWCSYMTSSTRLQASDIEYIEL